MEIWNSKANIVSGLHILILNTLNSWCSQLQCTVMKNSSIAHYCMCLLCSLYNRHFVKTYRPLHILQCNTVFFYVKLKQYFTLVQCFIFQFLYIAEVFCFHFRGVAYVSNLLCCWGLLEPLKYTKNCFKECKANWPLYLRSLQWNNRLLFIIWRSKVNNKWNLHVDCTEIQEREWCNRLPSPHPGNMRL